MNDVFMKMREQNALAVARCSLALCNLPHAPCSPNVPQAWPEMLLLTMSMTSWRERVVNNPYDYYMCGTYLSWQGADVEPNTRRKKLLCQSSKLLSFAPHRSQLWGCHSHKGKQVLLQKNIDLFIQTSIENSTILFQGLDIAT